MKEIEGLNPTTKTFSIRDLKKGGSMSGRREGWGMGQERGEGSILRDTEFEVMNEHSAGTWNKPRAFLNWRY